MDNLAGASLIGVLVFFGVMILLFFIFRSLLLWYWKLDKIAEHLESIDYKLDRLNQRTNPPLFHQHLV